MCLEQLYSVFDHQGVFGLVEILRFWCDSLLCLGLREPLLENGERGHGRAWFVSW